MEEWKDLHGSKNFSPHRPQVWKHKASLKPPGKAQRLKSSTPALIFAQSTPQHWGKKKEEQEKKKSHATNSEFPSNFLQQVQHTEC